MIPATLPKTPLRRRPAIVQDPLKFLRASIIGAGELCAVLARCALRAGRTSASSLAVDARADHAAYTHVILHGQRDMAWSATLECSHQAHAASADRRPSTVAPFLDPHQQGVMPPDFVKVHDEGHWQLPCAE